MASANTITLCSHARFIVVRRLYLRLVQDQLDDDDDKVVFDISIDEPTTMALPSTDRQQEIVPGRW